VNRINPQLIKGIITHNGRLFVSQAITDAIESFLESTEDAILEEGGRLEDLYEKSMGDPQQPVVVDYSGAATVDAYSVFYLPRNTLVPRVAILCCAYDAALQNLPSRLSVLDLGSGTGGVVLGLIDLLANKALTTTYLDIVALDASPGSLVRQSKMVGHMGCPQVSHRYQPVDLSDPASYQSALSLGAPYDIVFIANLFGEMHRDATNALVRSIAPLLSENGIMVSVESQSNYVKRQRTRIVKTARGLGLHVYYPCPPDVACPRAECWMWREDEFDCPPIMVGGQLVDIRPFHRAHWTILCKKPHTIYDAFHNNNPGLVWGVGQCYPPVQEDKKVSYGYDACTTKGLVRGAITQDAQKWSWSLRSRPFERGSVIGITADLTEIEEGWDIVSGFVRY